MAIEFTMIQSIGIAVVLLMLGLWLKQRIYFFERFAIPAPVIGGFLFAIINLVLHQTGILEITLIPRCKASSWSSSSPRWATAHR